MYDSEHPSFHPAVALLLKRMNSHPEEFTPQPARWDWDSLMVKYKEFLNQWERDALREAMRRIMLDDMHRTLMEDLLTGSSNLCNGGFLFDKFSGEGVEIATQNMQGELDFTNDR
ncbi:hypothetical protein UFOVP1058_8 [uncultured Caudovirales phage]|uniref:Uncharacterized protein n=1 Tax=uncultured Caudovirales phage TaxID=2100421 RepID=A0A6J5N9W5_9CAUD|nr:hypothetical protein UFOVP656_3 [uncultured Caudovirales phage]CAB4167519.1 hypothetical protein UFOVP857_25 [uncultured Caudovirales phage]CAB4168409.1 hypothetical protein UFOVP879_21 [uncultured Caudovirales phage]CAB4180983.1 hypothetical protein UFOVP1058_8 [uncultured Caudovirales phage]CAB4195612.1 hypothetical protein UFOVP1289_32 [uncultured Caudovirales phage]